MAKRCETRQTKGHSTESTETILTHVSHSKMLTTRRKRERAKKDVAGMAKRAKNLARKNAKKAAAPRTP